MKFNRPSRDRGFTLVELLVVIVIVAVLSTLAFMFAGRGILKAQQAKTLQQMRDFGLGIEAFSIDYRYPPIPASNRYEPDVDGSGVDTIYGDPDGLYGSEIIVGALIGEPADFATGGGDVVSVGEMNPRSENYVTPIIVDDNQAGVGREDGKLYDSWGNEIMIAVNAPPFKEIENGGVQDKILFTSGLAEWSDKKPRFQSYVLVSYGKDDVKADVFAGSDDVANF